jgi:hypothetical protein
LCPERDQPGQRLDALAERDFSPRHRPIVTEAVRR